MPLNRVEIVAHGSIIGFMNALILKPAEPGALDIDLVADFSCPWSFLGTRRLARALEHLHGGGVRQLRWHPFRLPPPARSAGTSWTDNLAKRLPPGISVDDAKDRLAEAGREFGIRFDFDKLDRMPDTTAAHRLVKLAAKESQHYPLVDRIYRAYFEEGRDIGDEQVLADIAQACGVSDEVIERFRDPKAAYDEVVDDEQRLRAFGVTSIPNLLLNGRVLVPGPADETIYVQALDQALFPQAEDDPPPTLQ